MERRGIAVMDRGPRASTALVAEINSIFAGAHGRPETLPRIPRREVIPPKAKAEAKRKAKFAAKDILAGSSRSYNGGTAELPTPTKAIVIKDFQPVSPVETPSYDIGGSKKRKGGKLRQVITTGVTAAIATATIGGLAPSAEAATVVPHTIAIENVISGIIPERSVRQVTVRNYAGYVEQSKATHIKGEFTVPKVTCPDNKKERTGIWIGEATTTKSNSQIWQGGVVVESNGKGNPEYKVFEELFPQQPNGIVLPLTVSAGDKVEVNLRHPHPREFDINITDKTTGFATVDSKRLAPGRHFTTRFGEAIVEDPERKKVFVPLARISPTLVEFLVDGGHGPTWFDKHGSRLKRYIMKKNRRTLAHAGPVGKNGSFTIRRG